MLNSVRPYCLLPLFACLMLFNTTHAWGLATEWLLPQPQKIEWAGQTRSLQTTFCVALDGPEDNRIDKALDRFVAQVNGVEAWHSNCEKQKPDLVVQWRQASDYYPQLGDNESYQLEITTDQIMLRSEASVGLLRGLATLAQLVGSLKNDAEVPLLTIEDAPRYAWRGLLLDVVRHWLPKSAVLRTLDALAAVKMNVLHLHLTDDQGFRIESRSYPKLHQLASDGNYFSQADMQEIINYAADRGIRVVPEIDMPAHTTSWLVAYPQLGSAPGPYQLERGWGELFKPVLNPASEETYTFIARLLGELSELFPDRYFHIGGDEVLPDHWYENADIQAFMQQHKLADAKALQTHFNQRVMQLLAGFGKTPIGWNEIIDPNLQAPALIQAWSSSTEAMRALDLGYPVLRSDGYYLDLQLAAANHYRVDPEHGPVQKAAAMSTQWESWSFQFDYKGRSRPGELLLLGGGDNLRGRIRLWRGSNPHDIYFDSVIANGQTLVIEARYDPRTSGKFRFTLEGNRLSGSMWIRGMLHALKGQRVASIADGDKLPDLEQPVEMTQQQAQLIVGGEAALWTEYVTAETLDSRLWPRTAAIAEKLWSPKRATATLGNLYQRLGMVSRQLESMGLTHNSYREHLLRAITTANDIEALEELVGWLEPVKYYRRQYLQYPMTTVEEMRGLVDALAPESERARVFATKVSDYLENQTGAQPAKVMAKDIEKILAGWIANDTALKNQHAGSGVDPDILKLSAELASLAQFGIDSLRRLHNGVGECGQPEQKVIDKLELVVNTVQVAVLEPVQGLLAASCSYSDNSDNNAEGSRRAK